MHSTAAKYTMRSLSLTFEWVEGAGFAGALAAEGECFAAMPGKMLQPFQFNRVWREIWTDGRELPKDVGGRSADSADPR